MLEAIDCTEGIEQRLQNVQQIIENRINGLGVTEPVIQIQGDCRILVELPAIDDPAQAIALIQQTGKLEWVDTRRAVICEGRDHPHRGQPQSDRQVELQPDGNQLSSRGHATTIPDTIFPVIVSGSDWIRRQLSAGWAVSWAMSRRCSLR